MEFVSNVITLIYSWKAFPGRSLKGFLAYTVALLSAVLNNCAWNWICQINVLINLHAHWQTFCKFKEIRLKSSLSAIKSGTMDQLRKLFLIISLQSTEQQVFTIYAYRFSNQGKGNNLKMNHLRRSRWKRKFPRSLTSSSNISLANFKVLLYIAFKSCVGSDVFDFYTHKILITNIMHDFFYSHMRTVLIAQRVRL